MGYWSSHGQSRKPRKGPYIPGALRKRTGAFNGYVMDALNTSVEDLFGRVLKIHRIDLSWGELLSLYVDPVAAQFCTEAPRKFNIYGFGSELRTMWGDKYVVFHVEGGDRPLLPKNSSPLVSNSPADVVDKITEWLNVRVQFGRDFGRLKMVLNTVNEKAETPEHFRFAFPPVTTLLGMNTKTENLVGRLAEPKALKHPPVFTPAERAAIRKAGGIVTRAQLIAADVQPWIGQVTITHVNPPKYDEDGFVFVGM
jgi:hypothetical protein